MNDDVLYTGSWERRGRSVIAAAVIALLVIGVVYMNGQMMLVVFGMVVQGILQGLLSIAEHAGAPRGDSFIDSLYYYLESLKYPILFSLLVSQFLLMLLPTLWIVRRWHTIHVRRYIRFLPTSPLSIVTAVVAAALFFPTNVYLSARFIDWLGIPPELIEVNYAIFTARSAPELIVMLLVIACTPALCEEVLFRGYVQRTFERTMGWKSILAAGFVFGLFHMQPLGLISLSLMGVLFGYLYYATRSLLPCIAAHFTNNAIVVAVLFVEPAAVGSDVWEPTGLAVALSLSAALLLLAVFHKTIAREIISPDGNAAGTPVPD